MSLKTLMNIREGILTREDLDKNKLFIENKQSIDLFYKMINEEQEATFNDDILYCINKRSQLKKEF